MEKILSGSDGLEWLRSARTLSWAQEAGTRRGAHPWIHGAKLYKVAGFSRLRRGRGTGASAWIRNPPRRIGVEPTITVEWITGSNLPDELAMLLG